MIANIVIQSNNPDDEEYTPIFVRKRQEFYLEISDQAKSDLNKVYSNYNKVQN
jgi:hypothetical protein